MGSRLLQRMLVHTLFDVPHRDIVIGRTKESKPFWVAPST